MILSLQRCITVLILLHGVGSEFCRAPMTDNSSPTDIFRPIVQRCPLPEITALSRPIEL